MHTTCRATGLSAEQARRRATLGIDGFRVARTQQLLPVVYREDGLVDLRRLVHEIWTPEEVALWRRQDREDELGEVCPFLGAGEFDPAARS